MRSRGGRLTINTIALSRISFAPSCLQADLFIVARQRSIARRAARLAKSLSPDGRIGQGQKYEDEEAGGARKEAETKNLPRIVGRRGPQRRALNDIVSLQFQLHLPQVTIVTDI